MLEIPTMSKSNTNLRQRKPIERHHDEVANGDDKLRKLKFKSHAPLPASHLLSLLFFILIVFAAVIVIEKQLPVGLKIADEQKHSGRFIAERAHNYLKKITALGPRVAGSHANEVLAVNLLTKDIGDIMKGAAPNNILEFDLQTVSGEFPLEFLDGMTNVYRGLQNIIVKIGSHIKSPHSLLINCHFDSYIESPGASDDGAGCAVMLEILRVLSKSDKILRHNIIFLFNGGEENFLPASHGFITQHKWAREVRAFINLEACGAGGREVLFQAGPSHPWLLETYSEEVPYPFASSMAQEIFQSGIVPGDTDFRIFRDFGNVSGLDFAWSANGYVYHTKFDSIENIPLGSLQRTGDNILALARGMAQGHKLADVDSHRLGHLVFFDFLGAFVVRWPMAVSDLVNITTVILSFYTIYVNAKDAAKIVPPQKYVLKLTQCVAGVWITWLATAITVFAIAMLVTALGRTMSWYARPLWAFFLYVIPTVLVSMAITLVHAKYYHKDIDVWPWQIFQLYYDAYQLIWTIVLMIGIVMRIRSSFIAMMWSVFPLIGSLLRAKIFSSWKDGRWLLLHIGTMGLPFVQSFYLIVAALYLFIPIMGRSGAGNNSELLIALMVGFEFVLLFSFAIPIILLVKETYRILNLLLGLFLLSIAVLIFTPLGFPYSGDPNSLAPQRFMLAHTRRTFHDYSTSTPNETTGYWVIDFDINSPHTVDKYVPDMRKAMPVDQDCVDHLYCGMPYIVPVMNLIWKTHWLPGPMPQIQYPQVKITPQVQTQSTRGWNITIDGPAHMAILFSPVQGVDLLRWSLSSPPLETTYLWNGRKTYFIYFGRGDKFETFDVNLEFMVPKDHEGHIIDLAVTSHYLFGNSKSSVSFKNFVKQFPPWTAVCYWSSTYESWLL